MVNMNEIEPQTRQHQILFFTVQHLQVSFVDMIATWGSAPGYWETASDVVYTARNRSLYKNIKARAFNLRNWNSLYRIAQLIAPVKHP